jgi:threonylcarbamoyladenosine tRNA methylthiotransferase MtaB
MVPRFGFLVRSVHPVISVVRSLWFLPAEQMTTFYIEQFGCRATQADGAALERQLLDRGCLAATDSAAADVVIVNTCTVTAAADSQARDAIRKIHARNPAAKVIVTGCYAQRAPEQLAALPGISWVVGNSHKPQIPDLAAPTMRTFSASTEPGAFVPAETLFGSGPQVESADPAFAHPALSLDRAAAKILTGDIFAQTTFLAAPVLGGEGNHTRPTLKIQDGCNSRCSYCVIPFVRGNSRSLPPREVIQEICRLSDSGYREIVLSGINLGTYGRDLSPRVEFEDLLRRILDETAIARLRISSIEPLDVTQDLIALFASTPRIAQHFHMPLQSGSDRILAAMHRWYRAEHYARRVELIREHLPHAAIGADVIAGFPGETEEDHATTKAFIDRLPFTYLHVFSFSKRPGTRAASFPSEVPAAVIHRRARELRALGENKAAAFLRTQVDRSVEILTLRHTSRATAETAWTPAISSNYLQVRVSGDWPPNQRMQAHVVSAGAGHLDAQPETSNELAVQHAPRG